MLNATIISGVSQLPDAEDLFTVDLQVEGNEKIKLSFLKKDDKYFVHYDFLTVPKNASLKLFADTMQGNYYEISRQDMEKIKNAVKQKVSDQRTK